MLNFIKESAHEQNIKPDVVILLDASGSMSEHAESVVSTFNEYIESVQETANTVSLYTFNSYGIVEKFSRQHPSRIRKLTMEDYRPRSTTPLYDAMGMLMRVFDRHDRIQFVTHTDGLNNDSSEWSHEKVKEFIRMLTNRGWLFVFLGEGLEGRQQMSNFDGVKMNFTPETRGEAMRATSKTTAIYAQTGSNDIGEYSSRSDGTIDIDSGSSVSGGCE